MGNNVERDLTKLSLDNVPRPTIVKEAYWREQIANNNVVVFQEPFWWLKHVSRLTILMCFTTTHAQLSSEVFSILDSLQPESVKTVKPKQRFWPSQQQ